MEPNEPVEEQARDMRVLRTFVTGQAWSSSVLSWRV